MKPEEEIKQELVEPDSDPGPFPAAQNTEPGPCKVSRKELHRRWMRYRPLHQTPIIPGYRGDIGYTPHQADTRFTLHQADTRYTIDHPESGYTLHQPSVQHPLLFSRRTPHA